MNRKFLLEKLVAGVTDMKNPTPEFETHQEALEYSDIVITVRKFLGLPPMAPKVVECRIVRYSRELSCNGMGPPQQLGDSPGWTLQWSKT